MIKNYFKVIIQNLIRNKVYSLINILGLSVGLAVCIIILQFVRFEKSYDKFHKNGENKYRAYLEFTYSNGIKDLDAANYGTVREALINDFPEVLDAVRVTPEYGRVVFNYQNKAYEQQKIYYADPNLFTFFNFKLLEGDPKTALEEPGAVVISKSTAEKYFGPMESWTHTPLNQVISMNNKEPLKITGIMEDIPANSHFTSEAIISIATFLKYNEPSWGWNDFYTYIELAPGFDHKVLESKFPDFIVKYKGAESTDKMLLQPLHDIRLHSDLGFELNPNGSAQIVYFLSVISILVLIIAWVNYINLSTARAEKRAKEIGVRKASGASRTEVMFQFLFESFFMNFIALFLAFMIVIIALPYLGILLEKPLQFSLLQDKQLLFLILAIYLTGSFLSGIYPAVVISAFKPVSIFKSSSLKIADGSFNLRQGLTVFQFIMSAGLITGTVIIENQMDFIRKKELGFNFDKTIILNAPSTLGNDSLLLLGYQQFKQELQAYPEIENISISSALPGKSHNDVDMAGGLKMKGEEKVHTLVSFRIDEEFINLYRMKMIAGKNISNHQINKNVVLLNRKGAEVLGYTNPEEIIGKKLNFWGDEKEIIGVIENYHHKSLRENYEPTILGGDIRNMLYISLRIAPGSEDIKNTIQKINEKWNDTFQADPFRFYFLDEHVNAQYKADIQFSKIFSVFSGFSIFIACMGLFGLVSYTITVRIKEIGVRKILGASISSIVLLFAKGYVKLLAIAFIIGIPLSHYILNSWVENFAYKASISIWSFIIPVIIVSLLALLAISVQILKAALANPVNALRNE